MASIHSLFLLLAGCSAARAMNAGTAHEEGSKLFLAKELALELDGAGWTREQIRLLISNLRSSQHTAIESSRFKRALLLSDTSNYSRTIQTTAGSHVGMPYTIFTHDPHLCVWISRLILETGWWEQTIAEDMLDMMSKNCARVPCIAATHFCLQRLLPRNSGARGSPERWCQECFRDRAHCTTCTCSRNTK